MTKRILWLLAGALVLAACGDELGSSTQGLDPLTCGDDELAYNFSRFPVAAGSSETASQAQAGGGAVPQYTPPPRNVIQIKSASCAAFTMWEANWAPLFKESCEGQLECAFSRADCVGSVRVSYACSDTPGNERNLICDGRNLNTCVFQLSCPQSPPLYGMAPPRQACVPRKCNVSTLRDKDLRCVSDLNRPVEYTWLWNERRSQGERMGLRINASDFHSVYPSVRMVYSSQAMAKRFDLNRATLPHFAKYDSFSNQQFAWLTEYTLPVYRIFLADTLYDLKASFYYVVPEGAENKGPKGTVAIWMYDGYGRLNQVTDRAFRCLVHSVDLSKYPPGTKVEGTDLTYKIELNERFVLPRDCRINSAMFFQSQRVISAAKGLTPVDFANSYQHLESKLTASYDMENRTILLDSTDEESKKLSCSVNPVNFYFDERADAHDRYAWYKQREIPLGFEALNPWWVSDDVKQRTSGSNIFVEEATQTTIGLSSIRPKAIEYRVKTVGPARGWIRVDSDWYLAGDRHGFWAAQGLVDQGVTLEAFLVPLDANDNELLAVNHLSLGTQRLFKSTAYGETISAKYPVTEALRQKFLERGTAYEASTTGKKFKLKMCVRLADGTTDALSTSQYNLSINAADKCRTADMPIVIKLDHAVTPLEPVGNEPFADSQPGGTGDSRMSQQSDNDTDRDCVTTAGVTACKTEFNNASEGQGTFGRSMLNMKNTAIANGATSASVDKHVEMLGFTVLSEEDEQSYSGPGASVSFNIEPDWDRIAELLKTTVPGPRYEGKRVTAGVKGLSIGFEFKAPVRYGLLQGDIIFGITIGAGAGVTIEYKKLVDAQVQCSGTDNNCQELYVVQPAASLRDAAKACYVRGGRLAELSSAEEATRVFEKVGAGQRVWLGGQIANEYSPSGCLNSWAWPCVPGHRTSMRWLSTNDDFATNTGFGAFSLVDTEVFGAGKTLSADGIASGKPTDKGVTVDDTGRLRAEALGQQYPSICRLVNTASSDSHELKGSVSVAAAAGISLGFCSPSAEAKIGVCIEGGINVIEAALTPSLTYTHHNLRDAAGRTGIQSSLSFKLDFEIKILSGSVDLKVMFFKWFNFKFNLFSFQGLKIPFDTLAQKDWSLKEDFQ